MGAAQSMCGQNLLSKLTEQYGGDVLKFLTVEKSRLFVQDKFTDLSRKFHESFQEFQSSIKELIQTKRNEITSLFDGLKNKANSVLPGGISALQRIKGQSINEFSGFNKILNQVQSIQSESLGNLSIKKTQMMEHLQQQKQTMLRQLQKTRPNIPLYDQVPEPLKRQFLKEVEKKFSSELSSSQKSLEEKILGLFNAAALQRMFQEMSPQNLLDQVLRNGFGILEKNIFANVGGIGNMIGNVIPGGNTGFGGVFSNFIGK